jgi:hypothetical protein
MVSMSLSQDNYVRAQRETETHPDRFSQSRKPTDHRVSIELGFGFPDSVWFWLKTLGSSKIGFQFFQ